MAYCTNCGAMLEARTNFCRTCGSPASEREASEPEPEAAKSPRASRIIKPDRLDKTVGLILAVIVGLVVVLYFLAAWVIPFIQGFLSAF